MDKLIDEFRRVMARLQETDPKLHGSLVRVIRRMQREFVKQYGAPRFRGWIDPWRPPRPRSPRPRRGSSS